MNTVLTMLILSVHVCIGQTKVGVSMKRIDSLVRTYTVTYVPPAGTVYSTPTFDDTVFCAAIVSTLRGTREFVLPMTRYDPQISEAIPAVTPLAYYQTRLLMPDSAYRILLDICMPTEQLPDGFQYFNVKRDSGDIWPGSALVIMSDADSALRFERRVYPRNYHAYFQYWESTKPWDLEGRVAVSNIDAWRRLDSIITVVSTHRASTFNRFFTLALLHRSREGGDSLENVYLDSAAGAQLRDRTEEPLLENDELWNTFYYPEMRNGDMVESADRVVKLQALAAAYPKSAFGKAWVQQAAGSDILNKVNMLTLIDAWSATYDVDVLVAIGQHTLNRKSQVYNPIDAERFLKRAETSSVQQLGFRNGENHFGSMGQLDRIRTLIVQALSHQGRYADAIAFGERAMASARNTDGRQEISKALVEAAHALGDTARADRFRNYPLPIVPDFQYEAINGAKGRFADHSGRIVVMDFWFVGCAGCATEHKSLNDFGIKYRNDQRVVFLSIALNHKSVIEKSLAKSPLMATVVPDAQAICDALGVRSFPTHVIVDQSGKTVLWEVGGSTDSGEKLGLEVEKLLK